jgi:gamma-glutamylcyclotransferase (GGCT)/AIG2-like uncharacterized protein YtfP
MPVEHLFVYGSLRQGMPPSALPEGGRAARRWLERLARPVGAGAVRGELRDLGAYPGLRCKGRGQVTGEVYRSHRMGRLLAALDAYETVMPEGRAEYVRVLRPVTLASGRTRQAWIYELTNRARRGQPIASGDYAEHLRQQAAQ